MYIIYDPNKSNPKSVHHFRSYATTNRHTQSRKNYNTPYSLQDPAQVLRVHPGGDAGAHARHPRAEHGARAGQAAAAHPPFHGQEALRPGERVAPLAPSVLVLQLVSDPRAQHGARAGQAAW